MSGFSALSGVARVAIVAVVFCTIIACEDEPETKAVGDYFEETPYESDDRAESSTAKLVISPDAVSVGANGQTVIFTARGENPPFTWGVKDGLVGQKIGEGHNSMVYKRTDQGPNTVTLTDSNGNTVFAIVAQP